jgi:hypothetical protein
MLPPLLTEALNARTRRLHRAQGDHTASMRLYERSLAIRQKVQLPHCMPSPWHRRGVCAASSGWFGFWGTQRQHMDTANVDSKRATVVGPQVLGKEHPSVAESYNNLALVTCDLRADAEALQYSEKCMNIARNFYPPDHPQVPAPLVRRPSFLLSLRRCVRAGCNPCRASCPRSNSEAHCCWTGTSVRASDHVSTGSITPAAVFHRISNVHGGGGMRQFLNYLGNSAIVLMSVGLLEQVRPAASRLPSDCPL